MNKNLLKIAGIISIVLGIICCLTIFGAIVGVPLIIGGNKIIDQSPSAGTRLEESSTVRLMLGN